MTAKKLPRMDQQISAILRPYPTDIRRCLLKLRELIYAVAEETGINDLTETVKWGEISYVNKAGSTLRMAWKASTPEHYAMYFHCQTTLVATFREIFRDTFRFEGNRAILFSKQDSLPEAELKQCILLSLTYHQRKHLPLLGC